MKALDLPLAHLADLCDPYLAELDGRAREAEPLRRRWMQQTGRDGDPGLHGLARARLAVNLVVQGAHRVAEAELRVAEPGLVQWAEGVAPDEAAWQLAVVACAWALVDSQLSVRVEPARERAALALAACRQALAAAPEPLRGERVRALVPWALGTASAWLTLLEEASPATWQEVHEAVDPVLDAALQAGDPGALRWFLDFANRIGSLGPLPDDLRRTLLNQALRLAGSPLLDLQAVATAEPDARPTRLDALRPAAALGPRDALVPMPEAAASGEPPPRPRFSALEAWLRLARLPRTAVERQHLAGACLRLAQRLDPPGRRRAHGTPVPPPGPAANDGRMSSQRAAADRLRLAAARLWAQDGLWEPVLDALLLSARPGLPAASADTWRALLHRLATDPAARTPLARARRRTAPLRRWLGQALPLPLDPVDEARWLADLASLDGRDAEALAWRRTALRVAERECGPGSVDTLEALQALHGTLARLDEGHPELEDLNDAGLELALRLCGPMSPEHWWWRGMRALWWHRQGHPQALIDAADEAEDALELTLRSGSADTCAGLRALLDLARSLPLPARSEAGRDGARARPRVQ